MAAKYGVEIVLDRLDDLEAHFHQRFDDLDQNKRKSLTALWFTLSCIVASIIAPFIVAFV